MDEKVSQVICLLNKNYKLPQWKRYRNPLDELLVTILSQNTNWKNTYLAFRNLKAKFPNYGKLYSASLKGIEDALKPAGLYRQKAKRIKEILKIIKEREGKISLKRLRELSPQDAYDYLISLPGVGEKTASCVLLFSLNKSALPVDTHIFRVSRRLGILDEGADFKSAHRILAEKVPREEYLNFHIKMIMHGRKICKAQNPQCGICFLNHLCDYAKRI